MGDNDMDKDDKDEYGHKDNSTDTGDKDGDEYGHGTDTLGKLIHEEVEVIVEKNPTMSVDQCVQLCDDLFPMSNAENERSTTSVAESNRIRHIPCVLVCTPCQAFKPS